MSSYIFESSWLNAFINVLDRCSISSSETVVVLAEKQSRPILVDLAEGALAHLNKRHYRLVLPTPKQLDGPLVRSSGASLALTDQMSAVNALCAADVVVDLTVEGLMHAKETESILKSGTRILNISNEHPEVLSRLVPDDSMKDTVKHAVKQIRDANIMSVTSNDGTDLRVDLTGAATVGVWDWPGGLVVSFPSENTVNGRLVLAPGDLNLTFKRYIESAVTLTLENDYVTNIEGTGADCALMKTYLADFKDPRAYATSHVGWGLNSAARYEAMSLYDKADTNGTELRAVAGNFLYSTGANEFANRFTRGHFDLPIMNCTIALDDSVVVEDGKPVS